MQCTSASFTIGLLLTAIALTAVPAAARADDPNCHNLGVERYSKCPPNRPLPTISMLRSPHAGSAFDVSATSGGRDTRYGWDLDEDGVYDDKAGANAQATFSAGTHTVSVRASDEFMRTATETRSFYVHAFNAKPLIHLDIGNGEQQANGMLAVTATGEDVDGRVAKVELDLDGDGQYEISREQPSVTSGIGYDVPGGHLIRARVIDDTGATTTTTAVFRAEAKAPGATVRAYADSESDPVAPGVSTTVAAGVTGLQAAHYEFDLDGDGTYETDAGRQSAVRTTFTAGDHPLGVRVSDAGGTTAIGRGNVIVDSAGPVVSAGWNGGAYAGRPVELWASASPLFGTYTFEWDADGDGAFDDGTVTRVGNGTVESTSAAKTFTYPTTGVYDARVRISDGTGTVRVLNRTLTVADPNALPPAFGTLDLRGVTRSGVERAIEADAALPTTKLTFDLDGDGQFDEQPVRHADGYHWTFDEPVTIAVKATDTRTGASAVRTLDVHPLAGVSGPQADLVFDTWPLAGGTPFHVSAVVSEDDDTAGCCTLAWDLDGDGQYDDGAGSNPALTLATGTRTVGVRATDAGGVVTTTRRTFVVGTRPPQVSVSVSGLSVTATATDPDGDPISSYEWDTDGDGLFGYFEPKGPTMTLPAGVHLIGVKAADPGGDVGIVYLSVTTADPVPSVDPEPTASPAPTASPTPTPPVDPGKPAPQKLTVAVKATKLSALLSRGLGVSVGCECASQVSVTVDKATAKRLKLKSRELGQASGTGAKVTVKLSAGARKALKRVRSIKLTVVVSAPGVKTVSKKIAIKR